MLSMSIATDQSEAGSLRAQLEGIRLESEVTIDASLDPTHASDSTAEFRRDLKFQPYVFAGSGSFISYGGTVFEFGGGLDWLVKGGLGLGFSLSVLGDASAAIAIASFDVSYHFIRDSSPVVPFVFAGIAGGSPAEYGIDGYTFLDLGGGVNLWSSAGLAFRAEVRGRFDPTEYSDHQVGVRLGVTF
jgi:hypothetical protein